SSENEAVHLALRTERPERSRLLRSARAGNSLLRGPALQCRNCSKQATGDLPRQDEHKRRSHHRSSSYSTRRGHV
ncbi:hypothetical protein AAVH_37277, partial [Aphelenchoides avenae]